MKILICIHVLMGFLIVPEGGHSQNNKADKPVAIVVHGGAGNIIRQNIDTAEEGRIKNVLQNVLGTGYKKLRNGESGLDVVEYVIKILEDSPEFNAGKGAVYNSNGEHELDAAIMDGATLNAGAVSGVKHIKNPISAARLVMEHSRHVLLTGEGAEEFVRRYQLEMVENEYFGTEKRKKQFERIQKDDAGGSVHSGFQKFGTVGVVVLDSFGNIAAGTSTGGLTNKKFGRIGDSPIIGAGTYANNRTCGISCTGVGEYFMRGVVAYDISALMEYKKFSLEKAARKVILEKLTKLGGEGGMIGLDQKGNISMVFNSEGMIRGYVDRKGNLEIKLFKD